uniref:ATP-binding protein n=1 Tax=Trichocoleus desertorum TaxID=1481672 RepID=UPI0025B4E3F5|nr:ATP-binding protein [Trichocoleus desertorum]
MHTTLLSSFIESVSICSQSATVAAVLHLLSQANCERLVVVDAKKQPIGLLNWPILVSCLGWGQPSGQVDAPQAAIAAPNLQQPLSAVDLPIVTPLLTLPAAWSLSQFWSYLQELKQPVGAWAVVNSSGEFLGLLDYSRLLQALSPLLASPETTLTETASEVSTPPTPETGKANLAKGGANGKTTSVAKTQPISLLIQLLERISLPLMVQTSTGQVLYQNQCWQQQIGELSELPRLKQAAETILNTEVLPHPVSQASHKDYTSDEPRSRTSQSPKVANEVASEVASWAHPAKSHTEAERSLSTGLKQQMARPRLGGSKLRQAHPGVTLLNQQLLSAKARLGTSLNLQQASFTKRPQTPATNTPSEQQAGLLSFFASSIAQYQCQVGSAADTCICTCPADNGQERIWQFSKSLLDFSTWETENPSDEPLQLAQGTSPDFTTTFQLADLGVSSTSSFSKSPQALDEAFPQETLWLVLAQDYTEQQQVNRTLAAKNADLVQLNLLKDEFLACISHELKTPLTAVLGLSNLLKDQVLGSLNERQARYASLIYQSGRHLMTVVNNILDLTRMETGQMELVLGPVHLESVCDRALEQAYQLQFPEEKALVENMVEAPSTVPYSVEIAPDVDSIVADEVRLRQMLVNLLSNAIKFTEASGHISLKVTRWEGWVVFTVTDTGIGIAADKQHLIFQKFQQLENPLTRRFEGTGLGLAITQRLARLHGGDVTFISKEGQGSQFTLLLPPSPPQPTVGVAPPLENLSHNRLVLIVESVAQFIEHLTDELTSLGYRVAIARSGTEALEKARRLQPCIIFLNPLLPLLSGWDVLTLLKSDAETYHIPAVITATKAEQAQAARYHADGFLCLPIQSQPLQHHLAHLTALEDRSEAIANPARSLTVLYLNNFEAATLPDLIPEKLRQPTAPTTTPALETNPDLTAGVINSLSNLLQQHHHRILEADDLEQAELLARVWRPDVLLIDRAIPKLSSYFQDLAQHTFLASLPIITLTKAATQAANQVPGLSIFPCLAKSSPSSTRPEQDNSEAAALMQAIQVAVGLNWQPGILVVDLLHLPDLVAETAPAIAAPTAQFSATLRDADWLQALAQYLQTAGLRGLQTRSWAEVVRQLKHQSPDLVLICLRGNHTSPAVLDAVKTLQQLELQIPILVLDQRRDWDHEPPATAPDDATSDPKAQAGIAMLELTAGLAAIATHILPPGLPVEELLEQIYQALTPTQPSES